MEILKVENLTKVYGKENSSFMPESFITLNFSNTKSENIGISRTTFAKRIYPKYSKFLHSIEMTRIFFSYRIQFSFGEVAEWFKAHAWKACKPFKGFGGSNPPLSAIH